MPNANHSPLAVGDLISGEVPAGRRTCRRCKGTGHHSNYGGDTRCFDCKGSGVVDVVRVGLVPATQADVDFAAGLAARDARAAARAARQAARRASS